MKIIIIILFCIFAQKLLGQDVNQLEYIDPFHSKALFENYNPQRIDFHNEFYRQVKWFYSNEVIAKEKSSFVEGYDFSNVWSEHSNDFDKNGIIGENYRRINIHFSKIDKDTSNPSLYFVIGKSRVGTNICDFNGFFKILKVLESPDIESSAPYAGVILGEYELLEDSSQIHSGIFTGIFESYYYIDTLTSKICLDESNSIADGYSNNIFVGTWSDYKTNIIKKCIWSDYRLPYCFDFDIGDGEMLVNKKYEANGWETFNQRTEIAYNKQNKKITLKDKWWEK